jgi:hypothetical protein
MEHRKTSFRVAPRSNAAIRHGEGSEAPAPMGGDQAAASCENIECSRMTATPIVIALSAILKTG